MSTINPQELISTLKSQHRGLQADLSLALAAADGKGAAQGLAKFKTDLLAHLKLEDEVFYPDYLEKKE